MARGFVEHLASGESENRSVNQSITFNLLHIYATGPCGLIAQGEKTSLEDDLFLQVLD